jgi:hypothetical protein
MLAALLLQAAIGQFGNGIGIDELVAAPFVDVAVKQPGHRIVGSHDVPPRLLRIIIHRKPLDALAVNPSRHYLAGI